MSTHACFVGLVDSIRDETSGTCAPRTIGSGDATVRAPEPSDHRQFLPGIRLEVLPHGGHGLGYQNLRI